MKQITKITNIMKQLNFLSKSSSRSCGHRVTTLASTVGSPSAHRRSTMLKLISVLVLVLTVGVGNAWGTTYQHVFNAKPSTGNSITLSSVSWNITATNLGSYNSGNYAGVQLGTKDKNGSITLTTSSAWGSVAGTYKDKTKITEIRLWLNLGGTSVTPSVTIGGTAAVSDGTTVVKNSSAGSDWTKATKVTFTPATGHDAGVVVINVSTVKAGYICCMEIDCEEPGGGCSTITPSLSYASVGGTTLTVGSSSSGSPTVSGNTGSGAVTYSVTAASPAGCATVNGSTGVVTAVAAGTATITASIAANGGYCSGSATANFTINLPTYTVSFSTGTGNPSVSSRTEASGGAGITLPAGPTPACSGDGWVFMGWKETSAQSSTTTAPDLLAAGSTYKPTSNCTLYAVYYKLADSNPNYFTKVTSSSANLTSGYYVIYANGEAMNNVITSNKIEGVTQAETSSGSGIISTSTAAIIWIIYKNGTNYQLYNAAVGKYLEVTGENQLALQTSSKGFTLKTFNTSTGQVSLQSVNKTSYQFQYYSSKFSSYGSQSVAVFFYKRGGTYNSNPTCCEPLGQINGSISLTNDGCGAGELKATWKTNSEGIAGIASQVLHVYKASDDSEVTAKKITGIIASTENQTQTISGLDNCTEYYVRVENISAGSTYCGDGWAGDASSSANTKGYTYSIGKSNVSLKAGTDEEASTCAGNFSAQYEAAAGYELPATLTVSGASAHTWSVSEGVGTLSISAANVTGNVSTTIAGTCITPNITADPASAVYSLNESATPLSVTVEGAGAWCGYQWESKVGNGNWTPIQNATSSSYMPSTASAGSTTLYHVIVSNTASGCSTSSTSEAATILVSALPVCASPTFSEAAGTKLGAQSITLSCEDGDATIYYTTNGDDPQEIAADLYDGSAIAVNQTTTIKAIAAKSGTTTSAVVSATYTIQCKAPTANVSAGTYNVEKSVELSSEYGTVYYTTDGSDPASGTAYNGAIAVSQTTTIRAIAKRANCENSEEFSATYTLKCATPTFSVAAGTHTGAQDVELSCATDGAAIHYTTNGNDPTGSSPAYSEAIAVSSAQTIKAIATKSGWSNSDIAEAAYTIQYAVKWYVGGTEEANVVSTTYVNAGSEVAPIADRENGGEIGTCATDFMGWTTSALRNGSVPQTADHYTTLFKYENASASLPTISEATSYYAVFAKEGTGKVTVTDELTQTTTGITGTNYTEWSGKTVITDAVYAGQSAGSNSSIQLRSNNSNSGIITTASGGKAKKVTVEWNSNTTSGRTINIYGKNSAYSAASDLYDNNKQGTSLGSIVYDTSTELTITGDYEYIGIRSNSGALYLDKVNIQWETTGTTLTDYVTECAAVEAPTFSVAAGTYNEAQSVELSCATNGATIYYTTNNTTPSDASTEYTGAIAVNQNMTIKAIAIKGDDESDVAEAAYVLKVATPTISGNTSFVNSATVTITAADGTSIYYTTNGVDPTTESTPYTAPFTVDADGTTTVKAIAVKAGWTSSEIASQAFTKITPLTVAQANTAIAALSANGTIANQYVKGLISQIDKFNEDNTITYWISVDGSTTAQLEVYHGSAGVANGGNTFTAATNLKVGEEVIVSGTLKKYEKSTNNYVYEFDKPNSIVAYKTHSPIAWSAGACTAELNGEENEYPTLNNAAGLSISYESTDEATATIDANGVVTPVAVGSTTIKATSAANSSYVATTVSYTLTVSPTVTRVDLDIECNGATSGCPGTTHLVKQTNLPNPLPEVAKTGKNFGGWYTDNTFETPAVAGASITENTTIYAQWLEPYTVARALEIISALGNDEKTAENVYVAGVVTADAVSIDNKTATYKIKDATVNNSLEVYKGKGLNNADVAAGDLQEGDQVVVYGQLMKYKGYSSTTKPEIVNPNHLYSFTRPTHNVTDVSVSPTSTNTRVGRTVELTKTIQPANASDKAVTWSSDAEGVATVDENGVVTGVAEGTAHITVTTHDGEFQATCTVTVAGALPTFTEDDHEWIKVSNASKLVAGRFYVIASETKGKTAGAISSGGYAAEVTSTFNNGVIARDKLGSGTLIFELGGNSTDGWTLYEVTDEENTGYLSGTNTSSLSWSASAATTSISLDESGNAILGNANGYRVLYNSSSPRFKGYDSNTSSSMLLPQLYMWAELSHSVTFDANGGVAESVPGVERTDEGKIIIPATTPTHSDISKAFGGWYKSDAPATLYNAGDEFTTNVDVSLYAKWNTVPTYTVTYSANGGTGTAPAEPATVQAGTTITVVENTGYTKPGFVYAGWQVVYNDGENDHIITPDEESKFTMVAYNVTIKALWEEPSNQKWVRVESTDELDTENGTNYIIVGASSDVAMGVKGSGNFYTSVGIVKTGNYLNGPESMTKVTLEAGSGEGKFAIKHGTQYIYSENAKNIGEKNDASDWTITITNGVATIKAGTGDGWYLKYNSTQPRFNTYASGQQAVAIYREKALTPIDHDGMTEADVNTYDDVEIGKDKTWTVSDDIEVGDVYMKEGSVIANSAEVKANDLYFKTKTGKSNQIYDASQLEVIGDLYYDVQLCDGDLDANYWYSIAVPFDVDLNSGVFQADGSPMTNRVDFEVWGYDTQLRAQTQSNGWKRVTDNMMHAGKAYLIGFNPGQPNIIRLKAAAGWKTSLYDPAENENKMSVVATGSGTHDNWNGLANPTMRYIDVDKNAQVFNNNTHGWDTYALDAARYNFVVGTAFFVQSASAVTISNDDHGQYRAPKRVDETKCAYAVRITHDEATSFDNQIIVRASEEATGEYTQGHDMLTMNGTSSNTAAMLWTENYGGKRLAIEEAAWLNDQASYALNMYAPKAGTYSISVAETKDNADLYLTQDGAIIWNLSMGAYELSLNKGLTNNYGLLLIKKAPGIATGVDEISGEKAGVQKIVLEDKVFILRGGKMYDVTGKAVK